MPDYTAMPNHRLANELKGLIGNTALLEAASNRLFDREGPVYHSLMPLLDDTNADLTDWLSNNPDDTDAAEVRAIIVRTLNELDGLDTTVRETY